MEANRIHSSLVILVAAVVVAILAPAGATEAQIYRLNELTTTGFQGLDRERTVVLIPAGVIEEHGPQLPLGTDSYLVQWLAERVAERIVQRPDWSVVLFPTLPIGVGAPEDFAPRPRTFGTLPLRPETKRAVLMDIASGLGEAGFQWIFVVDVHGPLANKRMTDQAGRYFEDLYGGTMVNLGGVVHPSPPFESKPLDPSDRDEQGLTIHAGLVETSYMLFLRPDLVAADLEELRPATPNEWADLQRLAEERDWPGYFGSPRRATTAIGADRMLGWAHNLSDLASRILDGLHHRELQQFAASQNPALRELDSNIAAVSERIRRQQQQWLEENGIR